MLAAVFMALPTLGAGFLFYDDHEYIVVNPILRAPLWEAIERSFADGYASNYHPLHLLSYWLDYQVWGLNPLGYRLTQLALYALSGLFFWRLAREFLPREAALWTALLFVVHPLHAESVSWISERKDLLCLFFSLLSLRAWLSFSRRPSALRYLATLLLVALALWSKSAAVVLPILAMLLAYLTPSGVTLKPRAALLALLPWVLLGALQIGMEMRAHGERGGIVDYPGGSLGTALLTQSWIELRFFTKHLVPWPLSPTADVAPIVSYIDARLWVAIPIWAVALWGVWRLRTRTRWPLFVLLWIVLAMAPTSNVVPIASIYADRWLLLATIGGVLGLGVGLRALGRWTEARTTGARGLALHVSFAAFALGFGALSWTYARDWVDDDRLWARGIAYAPRDWTTNINYGDSLVRAHRYREAFDHFATALEVEPRQPKALKGLAYTWFRARGFPVQRYGPWMRRLESVMDTAQSASAESAVWWSAGFKPVALALAQRAHRLAPEDVAFREAYVKMRDAAGASAAKSATGVR